MLVALDHTRMRKPEDLRDVFVGHGFEQRDADHMETDDDARNESHERNNHHQPLDVAFAHLVDKGVLLVLQETDHEVSRQRNEDRVDEKEVERPDEEFYLPRRQTEARRAEGGISAVAIATPGITVEVRSCRVCATMPARPPNRAISTS